MWSRTENLAWIFPQRYDMKINQPLMINEQDWPFWCDYGCLNYNLSMWGRWAIYVSIWNLSVLQKLVIDNCRNPEAMCLKFKRDANNELSERWLVVITVTWTLLLPFLSSLPAPFPWNQLPNTLLYSSCWQSASRSHQTGFRCWDAGQWRLKWMSHIEISVTTNWREIGTYRWRSAPLTVVKANIALCACQG